MKASTKGDSQMSEEKKFNDIVIEKFADGNYAVVSINRPDKLNSISTDTLREISEALDVLAVDSAVRCVVLRGTKNFTKKPTFSAGADLAAMMPAGLNFTVPLHNDLFMQIKHKYYDLIEAFPNHSSRPWTAMRLAAGANSRWYVTWSLPAGVVNLVFLKSNGASFPRTAARKGWCSISAWREPN
jgi:hypothetical protein